MVRDRIRHEFNGRNNNENHQYGNQESTLRRRIRSPMTRAGSASGQESYKSRPRFESAVFYGVQGVDARETAMLESISHQEKLEAIRGQTLLGPNRELKNVCHSRGFRHDKQPVHCGFLHWSNKLAPLHQRNEF